MGLLISHGIIDSLPIVVVIVHQHHISIVKYVLIICHSEERSKPVPSLRSGQALSEAEGKNLVLRIMRFFASLRMTWCHDLFYFAQGQALERSEGTGIRKLGYDLI
jgi:hypothetical protein